MVVYTSTSYAKPRYTAVKENLGTCKNKSGQGESVSKKGEQIKSEKAIRNPHHESTTLEPDEFFV